VTRTIETTIAGTQAMLIPPPGFNATKDVNVYSRDPVLADQQGDRGGLIAGHRSDSAVYVFTRPGQYVLPAVDIPWFDIGARRQQTSSAPQVHVTVGSAATAPAIAPEAKTPAPVAAPSRARQWWESRPLALAEAALVGALWFPWMRVPVWRARYRARRERERLSEPGRFRLFGAACRRGRAPEAYAALLAWIRMLQPGDRDWRVSADDDFSVEVGRLEQLLFGGARGVPERWNGEKLLDAAARLRRFGSGAGAGHAGHLPPLNPVVATGFILDQQESIGVYAQFRERPFRRNGR
jgi:hypothetical protein